MYGMGSNQRMHLAGPHVATTGNLLTLTSSEELASLARRDRRWQSVTSTLELLSYKHTASTPGSLSAAIWTDRQANKRDKGQVLTPVSSTQYKQHPTTSTLTYHLGVEDEMQDVETTQTHHES